MTCVPCCALITLPLEVIVAIMNELDWKSLLNMRQTCKHLGAISRIRGLWISQYRQYIAGRIRSARLEKPINSYSAEELERWVLLRRSADIGWKCQDLKFSRKRWIGKKDIGGDYVGGSCIVPGGRWLLVGGADGSVKTFDLDASALVGRSLIPPNDNKQPVCRMAVDVDPAKQSPNLAFIMALSSSVHGSASSSPLEFNIWRVNLEDHNLEAPLAAHHLCTIQTNDSGFIQDISLQKNLFARTHVRTQRDISYIEVFDWKKSTSSTSYKAVIFPGMPIQSIRLLPGYRLLAFSREHMLIYTFIIVEEIDSTPPNVASQATEPLWKISFPKARTGHGGLSEGLPNEIATHFVVKSSNLHGLVVPHNKYQSPYFHELMTCDRLDLTYAVGFGKAFIQYQDQSITRLTFSWNINEGDENKTQVVSSSTPVILRDYPTVPDGARLPKFDEESGRIVQDLRGGVAVIDMATLYIGRENEEKG